MDSALNPGPVWSGSPAGGLEAVRSGPCCLVFSSHCSTPSRRPTAATDVVLDQSQAICVREQINNKFEINMSATGQLINNISSSIANRSRSHPVALRVYVLDQLRRPGGRRRRRTGGRHAVRPAGERPESPLADAGSLYENRLAWETKLCRTFSQGTFLSGNPFSGNLFSGNLF
ncbi:hypothetical protein EYF80_063632 [Liparis tanakae]|uniref:Uncharacterized protein n=1 Tax=Liparis tanakae TaxID=230148 RepID=A0A4Z2EBV2_9TELE|nr:hypothetical protein EYF80_063632 [Liparis tanakae]